MTALARRYRLELDMSITPGTPVWTLVPGITEFTPKIEPTQQVVTTYDAEGWSEQAVTMRAWSIETTLAHRAHPTTGAFNAAQKALRKASMSFGSASYVRIRDYDRNGAADARAGKPDGQEQQAAAQGGGVAGAGCGERLIDGVPGGLRLHCDCAR
ncbi:hypothetical protein GCM10010260_58330 [Streptomyces filipinensis]|uniref:Uncharacterized protein n=1 Tax=Streptomyces filipinensis TaxID=66887 RepID=A0A918IFT0_9ACTN|nr:hypothetical protein [Streptomyces filipinensis]GGV12050.1 hypothetical protein GCM10010260_58330 [Streptomyces filipinensis]